MKEKKANKLETILSIVLCVILIPVILVNVVMIAGSYINPDQMPSIFGVSPVITLSGSMSPTFNTGSLIFIKKVDPETLEKGDIICFLENGKTAVTHRIEEVQMEDGEKRFVTKGDANNSNDVGTVAPSQVQGQYFAHWEHVGDVVIFMQSPTGMILFIALPIALYLVLDFLLRSKDKKKADNRTAELEAELAALRAKNAEEPAEEAEVTGE